MKRPTCFTEVTMKVADLPTLVIEELCQSEYWRIDIDPGLDAKHEFFLRWEYLLPNSETANHEEGEMAELINFDEYDVLLPIGQAHHPHIHLLRLHPSTDNNWLTLFLFDTYHRSWFTELRNARYGFLAVAERYPNHGCDFYIASYYHFSYLVGSKYEMAKEIMQQLLSG
jgi:hypothetical protein